MRHVQVCRYCVETAPGVKYTAVLPRILDDLLAQRKATRKMIPDVPAGPDGDFRRAVLDGLQVNFSRSRGDLGQKAATRPIVAGPVANAKV